MSRFEIHPPSAGQEIGEGMSFAYWRYVAVLAGMEHYFSNTGTEDMKRSLFTRRPEHPDGVVHTTKRVLSLIRKSNYSVERGRLFSAR